MRDLRPVRPRFLVAFEERGQNHEDMAHLPPPVGSRMSARKTLRSLRFVLAILPLATILSFGSTAPAADGDAPPDAMPATPPAPRPEIRLRGEVVETACFIMGNRRGAAHRQCAIASARAGQDLGILDEKTDQLYVAIVDRRVPDAENPLLPFIAHTVEVRGVPLEYGELPAITVTDVRSLRPPR